jgi:hypothetical protein
MAVDQDNVVPIGLLAACVTIMGALICYWLERIIRVLEQILVAVS